MLERRHHKGDCEIRTAASGKPMIAGYAAVFGKRSQDLGGFVEDIHPGAFERTLRTADVRALANHDANMLLGRSKSGTLRLGTDSGGLHYEIDPNMDDPTGRSAVSRVERGDWDGSSFSFRTIQDSWEYGADPAQRTLREVELYDVGPVTFPAYLDATSTVRGAVKLLAGRESRSVDELAAAIQAGSLRTLLTQAVELPEAEPEPEPEGRDLSEDLRRQVEIEQEIERDVIFLREHGVKLEKAPEKSDEERFAELMVACQTFGEERAGKTLSAASISAIRAAMDALENLIAGATGGDTEANAAEPEGEDRADGSQQALLESMNVAAQSFIAGASGDSEQAIAMQEIISSLNDLSENLAGTPAED